LTAHSTGVRRDRVGASGVCRDDVNRAIVNSKFLVLQSKRLMLSVLTPHASDAEAQRRVSDLAESARRAQDGYVVAVWKFGQAGSPDYEIVAYSRLLEVATRLLTELRRAGSDRPLEERYELASDVEAVEAMVGTWKRSMRAAMVPAVA